MAAEEKTMWRRPFIESSCLFTNREGAKQLISKLHIDSSDFLDEVDDRDICPRCYRSRKYYCYNCYVPMDSVKDRIPVLKLPVKIDIVKHPKEVDGKSTSAHAAVLAPRDVSVYIYPDFPDYSKERVILMFPGRNALPFQSWWKANYGKGTEGGSSHSGTMDISNSDASHDLKQKLSLPFDKVVFIDSTWKQTKRIYGDERIRKLPCVVLPSHRSYFWRHQRNKPVSYLATIEAIYYFLVELDQLMNPGSEYQGQYDNMLFFFKFMYNKIRTLYDPKTLRNSDIYSDTESS